MAIAACATLCGAKSFEAIAQWASAISRDLLKRLGCRRKQPPSEPTIRRVLSQIGVETLECVVGEWFEKRVDLKDQGLAIDGKTVRGSRHGDEKPAHLVSAVTEREGAVIAQHRVADKTNEIKSVEPLLKDKDIEGAIVTGDAMFAQKAIATYLVEEKKADYLFVVKANQPTLLNDIRERNLGAFPPSAHHERQRPRPSGRTSDLGE